MLSLFLAGPSLYYRRNSLAKTSFLKNFSPLFRIFKLYKSDESNNLALDAYIERGKYLAENPSKSLLILEDIIKGYDSSTDLNNMLSSREYKDHGRTNNFFIALAQPSLTGKTQMAFNIRSKRPLYFASQIDQSINDCFDLISAKFIDLACDDNADALEYLKKRLEGRSENVGKITFISHKMISMYLIFMFKSRVLGFLAAIIRESEKLYPKDANNDEWMRFYANNQQIFIDKFKHDFEPMSLYDFQKLDDVQKALLSKYFLFIDEFSGDPELVLIRNICRFLKVPCVLASTNAKVVNLVGMSPKTGSRTELPGIWSVVFPKFSNLTIFEVEEFFKDKIDCNIFYELAKNVSTREEERMIALFDFFKEQLTNLRPGAALILMNVLKDEYSQCKTLESLQVDVLFENVINKMYNQIEGRKETAFTSEGGLYSNKELFLGNAFDPKYEPLIVNEPESAGLIDNHFFFLKDARTEPKPYEPFLLFRSGGSDYLRKTPRSKNFYRLQCYFDKKEELLQIICLMADLPMSSALMAVNTGGSKTNPSSSISDLPGVRGAHLENVTALAFLESSHYEGFKGVKLGNFIKSLFENFKFSDEFRSDRQATVNLDTSYFKSSQIMSDVIVPFFYIRNCDWPSKLKDIFNSKDSKFRLGKYLKTSDFSEVDAAFDLFDENGSKGLGVIECKNRENSTTLIPYVEILEKAIRYSKAEKLENFLTSLRPLVENRKLEAFEDYVKSELKNPKVTAENTNEKKISKSIDILAENLEKLETRNSIRETLKSFIESDKMDEFEKLFDALNTLKSTHPLVHFLVCKEFSDKMLKIPKKSPLSNLKINFIRFKAITRDDPKVNYYEMIPTSDKSAHDKPDMLAIILETEVVSYKK